MSVSEERCVCKTCGRIFSAGERFCAYDGSDLQPERPVGSDPLIGTVLAGSYTLLEKLGAGGMGVVYRAWQNRLERNVAVKVLSPKLGGDGAAEERFRTEALAVSRLTNPHTVAVHDFGSTEEGLLYLVMKLAPGESLRTRLARGPIGLRAAVSVAAQICESLTEAHDRRPQIVHRDVKPDNILVHHDADGEDFVTVLDFGLAKLANTDRLTQTGLIVGTPKYMAPEQAQDDASIDARVDLYSLGVVLYEMVTGRTPFDGGTTAALLYKHVWEPPKEMTAVRPDLWIPLELERVVQELLAKKADERPASAHVVRTRLLEILKKLPEAVPASELALPAAPDPTDEPLTESSPAVVHPLAANSTGPDQSASDAIAEPPPTVPSIEMPLVVRRRWSAATIGLAVGVVAIALLAFAIHSWSEPERAAPPPVVAETPPPPKPVPVAVSTPVVPTPVVPEKAPPHPVEAAIRSAPKPRPPVAQVPPRKVVKPPLTRSARAETREEVPEPHEVPVPKPAPAPKPPHRSSDDFPVVPE